jgi:hypothetical protein
MCEMLLAVSTKKAISLMSNKIPCLRLFNITPKFLDAPLKAFIGLAISLLRRFLPFSLDITIASNILSSCCRGG